MAGSTSPHSEPEDAALALQGAYYVLTGAWPFLHLRSFLAVTGRKRDLWLLKTVAALVLVAGLAIGRAAAARRVTPEIRLLATGCALSLSAVDVWYVAKRRISPVYLLDAVVELLLVMLARRSGSAAPGSGKASWSREPAAGSESRGPPGGRRPVP